ncbi:MAG: T9SS type A sorting domain-containing protein [Bacteroidia bacterium]
MVKSKLFIAILAVAYIKGTAVAQQVTITVPSVSCQVPFYTCAGNSFTLAADITGLQAPYRYLWTGGATTATLTLSAAVAGDTLIRVRVKGANASGVQETVFSPWRNFKFVGKPGATISMSGSSALCAGQTAGLTAMGGGSYCSYLWSNGATTSAISANQTGNYAVTITNPNNCSAVASPKAVTIYDPNFVPSFSASGPLTFCKPGSVTLTADTGFSSYLWSTGATTQSITVNLGGSGASVPDTQSVSLIVGVNNGCSFVSASKIIRSVRQPNLMPASCSRYDYGLLKDSIRSELVLEFNGEHNDYEFEFTETTNPSNVINYTATGTRWCKLSRVTPVLEVGKVYNVRVRPIINGIAYCYGITCPVGISSMNRPGRYGSSMYQQNDAQPDFFNIQYDPNSSAFIADILNTDSNPVAIKIFDLTGVMVASFKAPASQKQFHFGDKLRPGVYFVEFSQGNSIRQMERLVKIR